MKVSFLLRYYNQENFVRDSIESILAIEKDFDWEILVGDDGSTDGTLEKVQHYVYLYPKKISVYVMPRDVEKTYDSILRGSANTLNLLAHTTGDYFCLLDGDDYYCDKDFVNEALKVFETDSTVSAVGFNFVYFQEKDSFYGDNKLPSGIVCAKKYLRKFYTPGGACVHKLAYGQERILFLQRLGFFEDNDLLANSLNYGDIYIIDRPVYAYRQTGQSVWTSLNIVEQNILNAIGADEELVMVKKDLRNAIVTRYLSAIIYVYRHRNEIKQILGLEKLQKYIAQCATIKKSLARDILQYDTLLCKEKIKVHFSVFCILCSNLQWVIMAVLRKIKKFICKA